MKYLTENTLFPKRDSNRAPPPGCNSESVPLEPVRSVIIIIIRENVGASTSHNPMGLHGLLQGYSFLICLIIIIIIIIIATTTITTTQT
jgi:hypothetical protein